MKKVTVLAFTLLICSGQISAQSKRIAVTFDELPVAQSFVQVNGDELTGQILGALKEFNIKATGFVLGEQVATSADLIGQWLNAGHTLGTMTWSNQDFHDVGVGEFMRQVKGGKDALEPILKQFGQKTRWFRYPFLHYGASTSDRAKARDLLSSNNLTVAHVTVMTDDFLYNLKLEQLGPKADTVRLDQLNLEYTMHVMDELHRQEELALAVAGRPVVHILQLRANRLNALFCWSLFDALKVDGYKFVSLAEALADPAYTITEKYTGSKGVGYLDMVAESRKKK